MSVLAFTAIILACIMIGGALTAILTKSLVLAAVVLGLSSVALAALLFILGASHAGGFELSVGAGLISVLFIIVISLTESRRDRERDAA
jgi:NADH-quinone oxidoreductase subunit J